MRVLGICRALVLGGNLLRREWGGEAMAFLDVGNVDNYMKNRFEGKRVVFIEDDIDPVVLQYTLMTRDSLSSLKKG